MRDWPNLWRNLAVFALVLAPITTMALTARAQSNFPAPAPPAQSEPPSKPTTPSEGTPQPQPPERPSARPNDIEAPGAKRERAPVPRGSIGERPETPVS